MSLKLQMIWPLVLGGTATSTLLGLFLIPRLSSFLVPKPRATFLSDILSFDKVLKDNITLLGKDGTLTQTLKVQGVDASIKTPEELTRLLQQKQHWLDVLSEMGATFKILTLRTEKEHDFHSGEVSPILAKIHHAWMENFKKTYCNQYYLVITHAPKTTRTIFNLWGGKGETANLGKLKELVSLTQEILHPFQIEILDNGEGEISALLSFWASLINGEQTPVRSYTEHISERLTSHVIHFDHKTGHITYQSGIQKQCSAIVSLKTWGEVSTKELLQDIQSLPWKLVILQLYKGYNKLEAESFLKYQQGQTQLLRHNPVVNAEYEQAIEEINTKTASLYSYQLSIFVFAEGADELEQRLGGVKKCFRQYGFVPVVETFATEWLWKNQFPGFDHFVRPTHPLSNHLAYLMVLDKEPTGLEKSDWGDGPLRLFKTPSGGAYALQLHIHENKEALAHSVVVAPAGSGKTTFFQHLIGGALRHPNLRAYIFDRFNGTRIFTQSVGGIHVDLSNQGSIPLNPLVCEDTETNRAFLQNFLLLLAKVEDSESHEIVGRAIQILFKIPKEQRVLKNLFNSLFDVESALRNGLKKWAMESAYARWFNGTVVKEGNSIAYDALNLESSHLITFEMTDIQSSSELASAMTYYKMHRIRSLARQTASPHLIFIDETKPMLAEPSFTKSVVTLLLEHRKLRGSVNLCFQEAGSIIASGIAPIILEQCPTRFLFPNPSADRNDYAIFDLTESEWAYIKGTSRVSRTLKHSVLVKKLHESVILEIDLASLGPLLHLYKSGSEPVRLVRELQQQWGMEQWTEKYLSLC